MKEPVRLLDELDRGFERDLLDAHAHEQPRGEARDRALALALGALSASAVAAATTSHASLLGGKAAVASSTAAPAKAVLLSSVSKWIAMGAIAGGGIAGATWVVSHDTGAVVASSAAPSAANLVQPAETVAAPSAGERLAEPTVAPAVTTEPRTVKATEPPVRPTPASAPPATSALAREVASLDRARAAIERDPEAALRAITEHRRQFADGALAPEAMVVEIEALARSGRIAAAQKLASRFLENHPTGALAERARRWATP